MKKEFGSFKNQREHKQEIGNKGYHWITDATEGMKKTMDYDFHEGFYRDHKAIGFLKGKGISESIGRKHGLQICEMSGGKYLAIINDDGSIMRYLCYPSNPDVDGELHDTIIKKGLSGFFNYERLLRRQSLIQDFVFVTDNVFTALSIEEMGFESISINNPNLMDRFLFANKFKLIIGVFDNDMVGDYLNNCLRSNNYFYLDYSKDAYLVNFKTFNEAMICDKQAATDSLSRVKSDAIRFYLQN